jgi:hypothetical protein
MKVRPYRKGSLMRRFVLVLVMVVVTLTAGTAAAKPGRMIPVPRGDRQLITQHHCRPMDRPVRPPVVGFLILDTARPNAGLFYMSSDNLTSGLFVGWGGTWELRYQCRR